MLLITSVLGISVFISLLYLFRNNTFGFLYIGIMYIALSLIDAIIPGIIWSIYGIPEVPSWGTKLTTIDLSIGILYYTMFYFIMFYFMVYVSGASHIDWKSYNIKEKYLKNRLLFFIIIFAFLFCFSVYSEVVNYGGYSEWIIKKFTIRFSSDIKESHSLIEIFVNNIPSRAIFNALVFLAFFYRYKVKREFLYGVVFPILGIIFALSTSYRGSILQFLLGLIFVEYIRIKIHKHYDYKSDFGLGYETIHKIKYYIASVFIVFSFMLYGVIRDNYAAEILQQEKQHQSVIFKILNQGSGLYGVSSIMKVYGNKVDYLYGKTYKDMLLLPVPRIIYTSKPKWYGIDDITRGMGWAETTQSAVTMPGEAYANFGWFGLAIAVLYGLLFGFIAKKINIKGGVYLMLYPAIIIPLIFVSNWMAFTGIMNLFFRFLFIYLILRMVNIKFVNKGNL